VRYPSTILIDVTIAAYNDRTVPPFPDVMLRLAFVDFYLPKLSFVEDNRNPIDNLRA
jgi:hypothetical protein